MNTSWYATRSDVWAQNDSGIGLGRWIANCLNPDDAKLIAQAPELLQVAEEMLSECQTTRLGLAQTIIETNCGMHSGALLQELDALIDRAESAIRKAKGLPA